LGEITPAVIFCRSCGGAGAREDDEDVVSGSFLFLFFFEVVLEIYKELKNFVSCLLLTATSA
jgi:hypothetical protein